MLKDKKKGEKKHYKQAQGSAKRGYWTKAARL